MTDLNIVSVTRRRGNGCDRPERLIGGTESIRMIGRKSSNRAGITARNPYGTARLGINSVNTIMGERIDKDYGESHSDKS